MIKYKNHRIKSLWDNITVIDTNYCGVDDIWKLPVYKLPMDNRCEITIPKGTSICQLEIVKCMDEIEFENVDEDKYLEMVGEKNRGGFGSTDVIGRDML